MKDKTYYRNKMKNILKILKVSKLWKQQIPKVAGQPNEEEELSTPQSKNTALEHKSRSLQKDKNNKEVLM